jgi:hypothetical protein
VGRDGETVDVSAPTGVVPNIADRNDSSQPPMALTRTL